MITTDLRGHLRPVDDRTHVDRLNDWPGSGSYVQGARRDQGDTPMPEGETRRYLLTQTVFDGFRRLPPGSTVELTPSQIGPHHALHPEEKYPPDHTAAFEAAHSPPSPQRAEEMISLAEHKRIVAALQAALDARAAEPTGLAALSPEAKAEVKEAAEQAGKELPSLDPPKRK